MNILEFIGFIVSLITFIFLLYRKIRDEILRKNHPELEEQEEQDKLQAFLDSLDMDESDQVVKPKPLPPPPPPAPLNLSVKVRKDYKAYQPSLSSTLQAPPEVKKDYAFHANMDAYRQKSDVDLVSRGTTLEQRMKKSQVVSKQYRSDEGYHEIERAKPARARKLIASLKSKKDLIILHELLSRPPYNF